MVAKHLDIDINYMYMTKKLFLESLVDVIKHLEIPIFHASTVSLYWVCKLAHSQNVKVMLSGEGADELFGGYYWGRNLIKQVAYNRNDSNANITDSSQGWNNDFLYSAALHYHSQSKYELLNKCAVLYNKGEKLKRWNSVLDTYNFLNDISEIAGNSSMLDNILGYVTIGFYRGDRMGMMASIENRLPFIENNIIN